MTSKNRKLEEIVQENEALITSMCNIISKYPERKTMIKKSISKLREHVSNLSLYLTCCFEKSMRIPDKNEVNGLTQSFILELMLIHGMDLEAGASKPESDQEKSTPPVDVNSNMLTADWKPTIGQNQNENVTHGHRIRSKSENSIIRDENKKKNADSQLKYPYVDMSRLLERLSKQNASGCGVATVQTTETTFKIPKIDTVQVNEQMAPHMNQQSDGACK